MIDYKASSDPNSVFVYLLCSFDGNASVFCEKSKLESRQGIAIFGPEKIRCMQGLKFVDFLPAYGEDSSLSALTFIPPVILQ